MNTTEEKALDKLIQVNLDSSKIYRIAAENSNDPNIQTFFDKVAIDREETMKKLLVKADKDEKDPSLKAELQQFWLNLKSAKKEYNSVALIDECIDAEKQLYDDYKELSELDDLPQDLKSLIETEKEESENNLTQLKERRSEFKKIDKEKNRETPV